MDSKRLEAFSDGVIAIIITIMVLELKVPHGDSLASLKPLLPVFLSYILSFVYVGIYWNNHHHMLFAVDKINGRVLWANLHLLFWLSMIPFATSWMGENHFAQWPIAVYGFVLLMNGAAYSILARLLMKHEGEDSKLVRAFGNDRKGKLSVLLYTVAIILSLVQPYISLAIYTAVAVMWFVPDPRIERTLIGHDDH